MHVPPRNSTRRRQEILLENCEICEWKVASIFATCISFAFSSGQQQSIYIMWNLDENVNKVENKKVSLRLHLQFVFTFQKTLKDQS